MICYSHHNPGRKPAGAAGRRGNWDGISSTEDGRCKGVEVRIDMVSSGDTEKASSAGALALGLDYHKAGCPGGSDSKESACNARDLSSIPGLGKYPEEENSYPLHDEVKMKLLVAQSCQILCDPMDCSLPDPLSMRFYKQTYWSGLPFPSPGDLPHPEIEPRSLELQTDSAGIAIRETLDYDMGSINRSHGYDRMSVPG